MACGKVGKLLLTGVGFDAARFRENFFYASSFFVIVLLLGGGRKLNKAR
jgi:hypothetical protein